MKIIIVFVALIAGFIIGRTTKYNHPLGDLRVDKSDLDSGPMLFLELDTDVYAIMRRKYITFRVKIEDFLPHK